MTENSTLKERLISFIKSKKIGQGKFEAQCGLSNGYVNNIRKSIQPDKLQKIALQFPDLNQGWLMSGVGSMTNENNQACKSTNIEVMQITNDVWDVIKKQADTLYRQSESLEKKDNQIDSLIELLREQISEYKKTLVQMEGAAICAPASGFELGK